MTEFQFIKLYFEILMSPTQCRTEIGQWQL